uniref:Uncharacterized LOC111832971 n=1 Tax=Paramormyrops kingsleyae TaxID=1676925 RepID=A0A3B3SHW5_9TELE|nr:uncharacterized protein LOC111832971 isoform X3 [Paramormyrops kingsleyae]
MQRGQTAKSGKWSCAVPEMAHCTLSHVEQNRHRAPALSQCHLTGLSQDSGVNFSEPNHVPGSSEMCRSASYDLDNAGEDGYCTSGFSEEHLLNITFEACDTMGKGEVLATTLMRYLQEMTAQSSGQDRLATLHDMLDPERKDLSVRKDTFHSVMRMWISRCCQGGFQEDDYQAVGADHCRVPIDGIEFSPFETEKQYPGGGDGCHCESRDLASVLEELKHTQQKLNEQNSSLSRTVSQCEDTNLQLIVEVTELRTKLASAQRSALRSKSLCDELEEARRIMRESQDKAAKTQASNCKLIKENEYLKAHMKIIEELNEKLIHEKTSSEGRIRKLVKINAEIREELDEILVTLAEKDKEITKKSVFIDDLKISYQRNCKIIEGMQLELLQLQENTQLELLRSSGSLQNTLGRGGPAQHQRSLQSEIEETQKRANMGVCGSVCGIVSPYNQRDRVQILQEMSSEEFVEFLAAKPSGSDAALSSAFEILERAYIECHRQQTAIRKHLANVEQELKQQKELKEETERKLTEQEQQLRETQKLALEVKEMVAVNCWRASKLEDDKARVMEEVIQVDQAHTEVVERLRQIEGTVLELQDQVCRLVVGQRITQQQVSKFRNSKGWKPSVCEANSEDPIKEACHKQDENRQQKDVVIATDPVEETIALVTKPDNTFDPATEIHVSLKGTETIVSQAFEATELDHTREKSFSQAKMRMDTATQRTEEELLVATEAKIHRNWIEACTSIRKEQSVGPSCTSDMTQADTVQAISLDRKTAPCQPMNEKKSLFTEGRRSSTQNSEDSGIACSADKSSQLRYPCFPVDAWHDNDCAGSSSLAKTSSAEPEETPSDSVPPLSESGHPQFTPQSQGPDPETCPQPVPKCDTKEHVGRQETTENSYSFQSEAADVEIRKTLVVRFPALVVSDKGEALGSLHCPPLPEPHGLPNHYAKGASGTSSTPRLRPRTRVPLPPAMPTLPEEEEDSPEELDSSSSSPTSCPPLESREVTMVLQPPSIIFPAQANAGSQDPRPLELDRLQSPRPRLPRNVSSLGNPITTVDSRGHLIDLVKDQLPNVQLSEEEIRKNFELLEEAKKVSDRFLMRRGRRSTCSLSDPPTGLSPCPTPRSSPVPSRSSSLSAPPQIETSEMSYTICQATQNMEVPGVREHGDSIRQDIENSRKFLDWKPIEKRKVSSGTLCPRYTTALPKEDCDLGAEAGRKASLSAAKPLLRPATLQTPCTAEIKTMGIFPPLMRAMSWDAVGSISARTDFPGLAPKGEEAHFVSEQPADSLLKSSRYKDFPMQPGKVQKFSKMREEQMLMRTQTIGGCKLPDLNETAEQDRASSTEEEPKEKSDVMPNISDMMLRKLKLHRTLPSGSPSLTEKEVENAFVQLSLAFRNDSYTLEMRLKHAEKERNLTEDNTDKELEEFKCCLKGSVTLWQNSEQREAFQRLLETLMVLQSLATRLSSRAEMVGAVRQEKRMNKATEVMMQYVENLKRTYEKDHAELMEFKKLANQNSNRCYSGSVDTGDDGVPRTSRSLSLTLGKSLPRRRVSVAVVPKFNLLNIPGQNPPTSGLPALCEASSGKGSSPTDSTQHAETESGKTEQESDLTALVKPAVPSSTDEISSEIKAKIEEDAYNKGYQEGLKRSKELQEMRELEEKVVKDEIQEQKEEKEQEVSQEKKFKSSKYEEALEILDWLFPKISKRNRKIWIFLVLFGIVFFMVNIFTYFSNRYNEVGNPTTGKTVSPGQNSLSGM